MQHHSRSIFIITAFVAGLLPATAAQAQWYSSYPRQTGTYGHDAPSHRHYADEVTPSTYAIRRPRDAHADARVICVKNCDERAWRSTRRHQTVRAVPKSEPQRRPADRALIEEMRRRNEVKRRIIHTTRVVRERPVVIQQQRVVDEPPRMIDQRDGIEYAQPNGRGFYQPRQVVDPDPSFSSSYSRAPIRRVHRIKRVGMRTERGRVIHAEAEVTILGPDRMNIRLYRKGHRGKTDLDLHVQ